MQLSIKSTEGERSAMFRLEQVVEQGCSLSLILQVNDAI